MEKKYLGQYKINKIYSHGVNATLIDKKSPNAQKDYFLGAAEFRNWRDAKDGSLVDLYYVSSASFGNINATLVKELKITLKSLIAETFSVETTRGKEYIKLGGGSVTSLPDVRKGEDEAVVFEDLNGQVRVFINHNGKPYLQTNKYDKDFPNLKALVAYLNKQKMKYIGID
jgi:hypothetical protein